MASRVMHYIIANEVSKEISIDRNLFVLGNLAPDAHDGTLRGNSCAHFRKIINGDYDLFPNIDLSRFKDKYMNSKPDAFVVGYYCHLISDDNWVKLIYPKYLQFDIDDEDKKKQRELLFHDLGILNSVLSTYYNLKFTNSIIVPEQINVSELRQEKLSLLLNELNNDFITEYDNTQLKIFSTDFIYEYMNTTIYRCIKELKSLTSLFT